MRRMSCFLLLSLVIVVLLVGCPGSAATTDQNGSVSDSGSRDIIYEVNKLGDATNNAELNRISSLNFLGKYDEALTAINKVIITDPTLAQPYYIKGVILYNMGQYDESVKAYDWGIMIDSSHRYDDYRERAVSKLSK